MPLDGFTVLDLSTLLPGPYCTTLLQTYGARIIKVETPAGDPVRKMSPAFFSQFNRGKASVVIDLKTDEGRRNLIRLAKQADALIEGFRPGVMARLGVGYDAMSAENPAIVYCSLSGFGQSGPYRDRPAHDLNFLGLAGYYSIPSQIDGAISRPNVRMADLVAGQTAAMAMAMAMISARQSGSGAHLDCSIYDSVAHWSIPLILANNGAASQDPADYSLVMADSGLFATRDGRYISLGTLEDKFWAALVEAIGHVEPRLNDDKWSTRRGRDSNKRELHDILTSCFLKKDRSEWALILDDIETAWGLVYQGGEVLQDNHLVARELISTEGGEVCAYPVRFSGQRPPAPGPVRDLGADTDEILAALPVE